MDFVEIAPKIRSFIPDYPLGGGMALSDAKKRVLLGSPYEGPHVLGVRLWMEGILHHLI